MTFVVIPPAGPAHIVQLTPHKGTLSDALGGAIPITVPTDIGFLYILRETAATDSPRNPVASIAATVARRKVTPLAGPVIVTAYDWNLPGGAAYLPTRLPYAVAENLRRSCEDIRAAVEHRHLDIANVPGPVQQWAGSMRDIAKLCEATPMNPEPPPPPVDPVTALFGKLGLNVHPQPFEVN